ncbi:MAG TPA: DUF4129 domain-containing protein [Thermomicrobiaceae bacterium]|nr:DUF4129 domain-containing protein [Thermomicrobiaceae bacterium]
MASNWLSSRWLDLLISLLVAAAEAAAVAPWLPFIAHAAGAATPSPLGVFVVGFVSFWAARSFLSAGWDIASVRGLSLALWLALVIGWYGLALAGWAAPLRFISHLASLDGSLYVLIVVAGIAWWRAISLASDPRPFTPDFARRLVWRGAAVIGAAVLLSSLTGQAAHQAASFATIALPVFLIASLTVAGATQAREARRLVRAGGDPVRLGLGSAAGLAVVMLLVAILVAGLTARDFWATLYDHVHVVIDGIGTAAYYALYAIAFAVFLVFWPFIWLFQHLAGTPPQQQQQQSQGENPLEKALRQPHQAWPAWIRESLEILLVVIVVAVIFWLVLRTLRRLRKPEDEQAVDEVHESVWSADLALAQLRDLLSGLRPHRAGHAQAARFDLSGEPADVREAYRRLVVLGAREGNERQPGETALDYSARLGRAWADLGEPLGDLTGRYLRARYAEESDQEDVRRARLDWRAIAGRIVPERRK